MCSSDLANSKKQSKEIWNIRENISEAQRKDGASIKNAILKFINPLLMVRSLKGTGENPAIASRVIQAIIPKGLDQTQKETKQSKQPKKVKLEEKLSNLISLIDHIYILEQELLPSQT